MNEFEKYFQDYFIDIRKDYVKNDFTEMTFRTALENFIEKLDHDYEISQEPSRKKIGTPDFNAFRKSVKIGYIETKKIEDTIDIDEHNVQLDKYASSLGIGNIIFTNYHKFRLLRDGQMIIEVDLFSKKDLKKSKYVFDSEIIEKFLNMFEIFFGYDREIITTSEELSTELAKRAKILKEFAKHQLNTDLKVKGEELPSSLIYFYQGIKELINDISVEEAADTYAQTITYGLFLAKLKIKQQKLERLTASQHIPQSIMIIKKIFRNIAESIPPEITYIIDEIVSILNSSNIKKIMSSLDKRKSLDRDPFSFFYEEFLEQYDHEKRKSMGVYFTPRPVVFFIIDSVNQILKRDFQKIHGYADDDVTVLDPATGTSTFLWAIFHSTLKNLKTQGMSGIINEKIEKHVLKNFYGFEIQIAPYIFAHLKLSAVLEEFGYQLKDTDRAQIYLTNTLEPSETHGLMAFMKELNEENHVANIIKSKKNILVIMGNPPYRSLSQNNSQWIQNLLKKGYAASDGRKDDGYYYVDGKPLGDKNPKGLQDDYVKFIRFAQWKIDISGEGIVSYITNHGYLDNLTFRGMRQSLLKTFNRIYVLNLHGDMRKKEKTPRGETDENVFESIMQGVSILICIKSDKYNDHKIFYEDLWGKRFDKYALLDRHIIFNSDDEKKKQKEIEWSELTPTSPNYYFIRKDRSFESSYEQFWSVNDMFEIKSTTINTARDKLTIQFSPEEVSKTIKKFVELDENAILNQFQVKDSSDWKIGNAKKDLINSGLDKSKIIPILYRPFDIRYTYYTGKSGGFMGRPRYAVMQHMLQDNLALMTRKRMQKPFNFSFVSDKIFAHGTIASDALGIEYAFPLYQYDLETLGKKSNLNPKLFSHLEKLYKKSVTSEQIFYYVYAVLYSRNYRKKFATFLAEDFPKIPFTKNYMIFERMIKLGEELVLLHTNKKKFTPKTKFNISGSNKIEKIKFDNGKIFINNSQYFEGVSEDVWNFAIGSYTALKKWLEGKGNRTLENKDIEQFMQIPEIIQKTISCMDNIDKLKFYEIK